MTVIHPTLTFAPFLAHHNMAPSEDSDPDYDQINARVQHTQREATPESQGNERTPSDFEFAAVGGQFETRRDSYPHDLELSESENNDPQPCSPGETEPSANALSSAGNRPPLGSALISSVRTLLGPYIGPDDYRRSRLRSVRRSRRRLRGRSGAYTTISYLYFP
jgi:hypothetical protein